MGDPAPPIDIEAAHQGDWLVVSVRGDLDMATAPVLEAAAASIDQSHPVALDLAGVGFIDSTGLRALLDLGHRIDGLVLYRPSGVVRRLLQLTETSDDIEVVEELTEPDPAS